MLWLKLLPRLRGLPLLMLPHEFRAVCNGTGLWCESAILQTGGGKGTADWCFRSCRCRWETHTTTPASLFPACTVPLSPINAQRKGRWISWSSQLTRFPQPPLQLNVVAFQAAWCYFTVVGVSVSSCILQWFVTYRYLGFVVHFNSSKSSFRFLPSLLPEEVNR